MESKDFTLVSTSASLTVIPLNLLPIKDLIKILKDLSQGISPPPSYSTMEILDEADRRPNLLVTWSLIADIAPMATEQPMPHLQPSSLIPQEAFEQAPTKENVNIEPAAEQI